MEELFLRWAGEPCVNSVQISANGSNRQYFRLEGATKHCIAARNNDVAENEAFFYFATEMKKRGINVPEVYAVNDDRTLYLQEDLGNTTLYTYLTSRKTNGVDITVPMQDMYKSAIDNLIEIQDKCKDVDFSHSYPAPAFDRQAIQWDLNYFKYYFLRLFHVPFDEHLLENDFSTFINYLLDDDCNYFMYRDFQSRNIMIVDDKLFFIDFQGARRGAAEYDLASLLFSSKSDVPDSMRQQLLEYYMNKRAERNGGDKWSSEEGRNRFRCKYYGYVLARMMQAMGAYGYRGIIEKKEHFIKSIPFAVRNLRSIIDNVKLPIEIPHLESVWKAIADMEEYKERDDKLIVSVFSFSYRKGIPFDKYGNGGGFVFDCRSLPNPGLYDEYKNLNGKDKPVIDFFLSHPETEKYLSYVKGLLEEVVTSYIEKGYTRLMVNFGCTGGRHRSVYCAEQVAKYLGDNFDCTVNLYHLEQGKLQG